MSPVPTVSVVIPCYDLGRYVDEAVESCLTQTLADVEVLVIDDGSTDPTTRALLERYERPRTRVIRIENRGLPRVRNLGASLTTGRYLCFLDADDRLAPTFFEQAVRLLDREPAVAFVSSWFETFGAERWVRRATRCDLAQMLVDCEVYCAAVQRRSALEAVGGYDEGMPHPGYEDWDLWIRLLSSGHRGEILPEVLFHYRRRAESMLDRVWLSERHLVVREYMFEKHAPAYRAHLDAALDFRRRKIDEARGDLADAARALADVRAHRARAEARVERARRSLDERARREASTVRRGVSVALRVVRRIVDRARAPRAPGRELHGPSRDVLDGARLLAQAPPEPPALPDVTAAEERYRTTALKVGLAVARGDRADELLDSLRGVRCPDVDLDGAIVAGLVQAVRSRPEEDWPGLLRLLDEPLARLEASAGSPDLARGARLGLEARLGRHGAARPRTLGATHVVHLELEAPPPSLELAPDVERLGCEVTLGGAPLGWLWLPVFAGRVPREVLSDAAADAFAWPLLHAYLRRRVLPELEWEDTSTGVRLRRRGGVLAEGLPAATREDEARLLEALRWCLFLQELWGRPDWPEGRFYDPTPAEGEPAHELQAPRFELEVSEDMPTLTLPGDELEVTFTVGGVPLGEVRIAAPGGRLTASALRAAALRASGFELARAAVRGGLLWRPLQEEGDLRQRLRSARGARGGLEPQLHGRGALLGRRVRGALDTSVSRWAALPVEALPELVSAARLLDEPVLALHGPPDAPRHVLYVPQLLSRGAPAELTPALPTPAGAGPDARHLPILMYHRVIESADACDVPFAISARAFEEQLAVLRSTGHVGITLARWREALAAHAPLPGRAVLLTFDDGYRDFQTVAWPLLQRYGFTALLFATTDAADRREYLDRLTLARTPALGWRELRELADAGVEIGAHTRSHPFLTRVTPTAAAQELAGARARLQDELGRPVRALAYPFGDADPIVRHLAGACGYTAAVTCEQRASHLFDDPLLLPRLDAGSSRSLRAFAGSLGLSPQGR